jgi:hypothetical protein
MERKLGKTATVAADQVDTALTKARELSGEEEKVLRMRRGALVDLNAPLAKAAAESSEVADELLLLEVQLFRAYRRIRGSRVATARAAPPSEAPADVRAKSKIIRALRKKR